MPSYFSPDRQPDKRATSPVPSTRLVSRDGTFDVVRAGVAHAPWRDAYHLLLTLPWPIFLGGMGLMYFLINALFALAYLAGGNGIENARPGSFADAFFFSVQTMASIGYGAMYPRTTYANILVVIEALLGLLALAIATGLMFARFARPTARVMFSNVAVIAPHNGLPTLMFRMANQRRNSILEAEIRLILVRNEQTQEGELMRRFQDLDLARSRNPIFALTWTAMHPITPNSPLYGYSLEDLETIEAELIVTLVGLDETFGQTIHARHSYIPQEMLWDMRFVDLLAKTADGRRLVNYRVFHQVMPLTDSIAARPTAGH